MKIAVLANGLLKEEMQQKISGNDVSIVWANSIEELIVVGDADAYFDLEFSNETERIDKLQRLLTKPVFINAVVDTLSSIGKSFIRINAWHGFLERSISEVVVMDEEQKTKAEKIFDQLNWNHRFVPDIQGMVTARILAMMINEAYYTLQDDVSTKEEIDIAMKLGTNYPFGPFEWSEKIGLKNIYYLLVELSKTDNRYQAAETMVKEVSTPD